MKAFTFAWNQIFARKNETQTKEIYLVSPLSLSGVVGALPRCVAKVPTLDSTFVNDFNLRQRGQPLSADPNIANIRIFPYFQILQHFRISHRFRIFPNTQNIEKKCIKHIYINIFTSYYIKSMFAVVTLSNCFNLLYSGNVDFLEI